MSTLDQPLLIANSGYHVGHQRTIRVAEELGYFREEGLTEYEYDFRGLIPGDFEAEGLGTMMREHGVDIAGGPNIESVLIQHTRGEDMLIVGGWRYASGPVFIGAKGISDLKQLKGKRIGILETGMKTTRVLVVGMRRAGIDPMTEVEWVRDPMFGGPNREDAFNALRKGFVDVICTRDKFAPPLIAEGYSLLIDGMSAEYMRKPGRVIVATRQTVDKRTDELKAFLRAHVRAIWYWQDPDNFHDQYERETRYRQLYTHNEIERQIRVQDSPAKPEESIMPMDGRVSPDGGVEQVIQEMLDLGELDRAVKVDDVLREEFVIEAYKELLARPSCQAQLRKLGVLS